MKVVCVGGGPASLYFSIMMKRVNPSYDITVYERNLAGSTYGWGVTYWDELFNFLHGVDPESARAVSEASVRWDSWVVELHNRATIRIEHGDEGSGIGRRRLLDILAERARALDVRIEFEQEVADEREFPDADLIVAGDGVNSVLRDRHADHFGTNIALGRNKYMWLGTTRAFESFLFAYTETPHGWIWCYGYPYDPGHSTIVVECSPETWAGLGLKDANEADNLAMLEKLFADVLEGHPLMGRTQADGTAHWLNFRTVTNRRWYRGNLVLIGDAAHTTHYSIGAGTTLALGDVALLVRCLHREARLDRALARYQRGRLKALRPPQKAARYSARWYENLPRYINRPPHQMIALLDQRHSGLLAYTPPGLYYGTGQLLNLLSSIGGRRRRTVHTRSSE